MTQYSGKVIRKTPVTPTQASASGVWKLNEQAAAIRNNTWPVAGVPDPISRSVRLRSSASAYFNRTPAAASNRRTMTLSMWQKRGDFSGSQEPAIMWAGTNASNYTLFRWGNGVGNSDSKFFLNFNMFTGGSTNLNLVTTSLYRDPSAWYHIVLSIDTTQATAANRVRLYVNGVQVTSFSSASYPSQNLDLLFNSTNSHEIGRFNFGSYLDGYLAEFNFIDGQALTPSSFGTTDPLTGAWIPMQYTGTYGTNGFYVDFRDNTSTTTLGYDYSGNSNNWTANNISLTAGVTYDSMLDVPTPWIGYSATTDTSAVTRGNYAVVNPLSKGTSQVNVIDGNLYAIPTSGASNWGTVFSSFAIPTSGKWYIEGVAQLYAGSGNNSSLGVVDSASFIPTNTAILYQYTTGEGFDGILAHLFNDYVSPISDGVQGTNVTGLTGTSINLMLALDVDNGKVYAGYNGTWLNSGNPAAGTGEIASRSFSATDVVAGHTSWNGTNDQSQYFNFGQRPFNYSVPTGFKTLCATNLPTPTILNGASYMAATTYTGNNSTNVISNSVNGVSMQPDFVWIKSRSSAFDHALIDSIRGVTKWLASNTTAAEATSGAGQDFVSFNSNGFTLGPANTAYVNNNSLTFVAWQWRANGTPAVTNTNGSITSTVSANTTAGFSVVTYTGTGANATVGHGLGVAPRMIIVKRRDSGPSSWTVWHSSFSSIEYIYLNLTNAKSSSAGATVWNSTLPTSSVFSLGTYTDVNASGGTHVAYCFAAVAGYSAFGSYTGNGSSDGPFVFCGFRPRWVMVKKSSSTGSWAIVDTARNTFNVANTSLYADLSNAENSSFEARDYLSNGFKLRTTDQNSNENGQTFIYAAFAELPFKFANAR